MDVNLCEVLLKYTACSPYVYEIGEVIGPLSSIIAAESDESRLIRIYI